jgi:hypothetical protein
MMFEMLNTEMNSIIEKVVKECSKHYGFDSEEAMMRLGLKSVVKEVVKEVVVEEEKKSKNKKIVLPYNNEYDNLCCSGLELNHGLYTQCPKKKKVNNLCEGCNKQALNNSHGKPDYGLIEERQETGIMDFRDPKGKSPVSYIKIMKKLGLSQEEVEEEAKKRNKKINEIHFMEEEDKKKGRPKKSKKELEVEGETNDLFAELVASSSSSSISSNVVVPTLEIKVCSSPKKLETTPRLEEESPSPKEKSPKEKVVKEKVVKEKSPKEKVVKEKSPKEKVVKEKVVKEKVPKEKVIKEKVVKEKVVKEKVVKEKVVKDKKEKAEEVVVVAVIAESESENIVSTSCSEEKEVEEEADVVKRFEHEGIKYLKSKKSGIIYNMDQEVIGKWNEELQKIDLNEETEEEEEEEYDE